MWKREGVWFRVTQHCVCFVHNPNITVKRNRVRTFILKISKERSYQNILSLDCPLFKMTQYKINTEKCKETAIILKNSYEFIMLRTVTKYSSLNLKSIFHQILS